MNQLDLDSIGIIEGTNKSSMHADYLRHYQAIFEPFRNDEINILEIGIETGASLGAWQRYFEKAVIVGIDISANCKVHENSRTHIFIGSQDDPNLLETVARSHPPTIIIDDASHKPEHIVFSFERLFPSLLPGGIYIIEDLKGHYDVQGELTKGQHGISPISNLLDWSQWLASGRIPPADNHGINKFLFSTIDSVQFVSGAAIVRKKAAAAAMQAKFSEVERLLGAASSPGAWSWSWFAAYVVKNRGPMELAERAARRAVEMAPTVSHHRLRLSSILEQRGDLPGAIDESKRAIDLAEGPKVKAGFQANLDRLLAKH